MRSLQRLNLATCTSELRAKRILKRFRDSSELPINPIGSGVLRTEDIRHITRRPCNRLRCSFIEAIKSETLPENFSGSAKSFTQGLKHFFNSAPWTTWGMQIPPKRPINFDKENRNGNFDLNARSGQ